MIGLTTGRQTSQRLNSLLKELAYTIPGSKIIRRGKSSLEDLADKLCREGANHALALYRWHGGPGRMDLFEVEAKGLMPVAPSALLKGVKLRREIPHRGRHIAEGITCGLKVSEETRQFMQSLSRVLELPELHLQAPSERRTTFHLSEETDGTIWLGVTSPPGEREMGPTLLISRLRWDLNGDGKKD